MTDPGIIIMILFFALATAIVISVSTYNTWNDHDKRIELWNGVVSIYRWCRKNADNVCDPTAVRFYKETVFGLTAEDVDIVKWICILRFGSRLKYGQTIRRS